MDYYLIIWSLLIVQVSGRFCFHGKLSFVIFLVIHAINGEWRQLLLHSESTHKLISVVVYFDQCLGASHSKCSSKMLFLWNTGLITGFSKSVLRFWKKQETTNFLPHQDLKRVLLELRASGLPMSYWPLKINLMIFVSRVRINDMHFIWNNSRLSFPRKVMKDNFQ